MPVILVVTKLFDILALGRLCRRPHCWPAGLSTSHGVPINLPKGIVSPEPAFRPLKRGGSHHHQWFWWVSENFPGKMPKIASLILMFPYVPYRNCHWSGIFIPQFFQVNPGGFTSATKRGDRTSSDSPSLQAELAWNGGRILWIIWSKWHFCIQTDCFHPQL